MDPHSLDELQSLGRSVVVTSEPWYHTSKGNTRRVPDGFFQDEAFKSWANPEIMGCTMVGAPRREVGEGTGRSVLLAICWRRRALSGGSCGAA